MNWQKRLLVVLTLILLASVARVLAQPRFEIPLTVTDSMVTRVLYFGILPGANYCINPQDSINGHIESFLPPPPQGIFDSRFKSPRPEPGPFVCFDQGSLCDYRPFNSYIQRDTFRVNIVSPNSLPVTVSWPSGLSAYFRKLILKYIASGGAIQTIDMLTTTSAAIDLDPVDVKIYAGGPRTPNDAITVQVQVNAGWNLISNPVKNAIPGDAVRQIFPTSLYSYVIGLEGGYVLQYRVVHGKGGWCKFPAAITQSIRGTGYTNDTISVSVGWRFIGTAFYPVPVDSVVTIPPGIIASKFFEVRSGYARSDTLWPGRGYCVKMLGPGLLVLPGGF